MGRVAGALLTIKSPFRSSNGYAKTFFSTSRLSGEEARSFFLLFFFIYTFLTISHWFSVAFPHFSCSPGESRRVFPISPGLPYLWECWPCPACPASTAGCRQRRIFQGRLEDRGQLSLCWLQAATLLWVSSYAATPGLLTHSGLTAGSRTVTGARCSYLGKLVAVHSHCVGCHRLLYSTAIGNGSVTRGGSWAVTHLSRTPSMDQIWKEVCPWG